MTAMHCVEEASSLTVALGEHNIRADIENHQAKVDMMMMMMMTVMITVMMTVMMTMMMMMMMMMMTMTMMMTMISMMMILGEHNIRAEIETLFLLTLHGQCCFDVSPLYIKNNKKLHKSQPKKSNKIINWV